MPDQNNRRGRASGPAGARRGAPKSARAAQGRGAPKTGQRGVVPNLPRLGPDDEWPYAPAREGRRPTPRPAAKRSSAPRASGDPKVDGRSGRSGNRNDDGRSARGGNRNDERRSSRTGDRSDPRRSPRTADRTDPRRSPRTGDRRDDQRRPPRSGERQGDGRSGRSGGRNDDRDAARAAGRVTGPFTRRKPAVAPAEPKRSSLRIKASDGKAKPPARDANPSARKPAGRTRGKAAASATQPRPSAAGRRRRKTTEATEELRRLAGSKANRAIDALASASDAFARGHERDALRILKPLIEMYPRAAAVRELAGLCRYRLGTYTVAADDLAAFVDITGSTEQHPVLMDCRRAQGKLREVEELWEELRESSPSAALVTEGRIVYAGALADAGRLKEAIDLLARRSQSSGRTQEHMVRLWYALADLYDRSGDVPRARALFEQVRDFDAEFADVAERLATLS